MHISNGPLQISCRRRRYLSPASRSFLSYRSSGGYSYIDGRGKTLRARGLVSDIGATAGHGEGKFLFFSGLSFVNISLGPRDRDQSTYSSNIQRPHGGRLYLMLFYARPASKGSRNSVRLKKKISASVFYVAATMAAGVAAPEFHTSTLYSESISFSRPQFPASFRDARKIFRGPVLASLLTHVGPEAACRRKL